jgi:hypothetical protein
VKVKFLANCGIYEFGKTYFVDKAFAEKYKKINALEFVK